MKKVVTFGEIMGRFSPPGYGKIIQSQSLNLTFGGGEANVAGGLAHLGIPATHVTKFPANELGKAAAGYYARVGVDTSEIQFGEGRLGLYFVEFGAAMRPIQVTYDRADSAFANLDPADFNWHEIFKDPYVSKL